MAWALKFDGVNDYAPLSAPISNPVPVGGSLRYVGANNNTGTNLGMFLDIFSGGGDWLAINASGYIWVRIDGQQVTGTISTPVGDELDLLITRSLSEYIISVGGVEDFRVSKSANLDPLMGVQGDNYRVKMQVKTLTLNNGVTDTNKFDATASSHAAGTPVLTDTIGGNNATGVNMPTDGSAWVDLGGGGVTVTAESGTYSQVGTDTPITSQLNIITTAGSYLLTGSNVNLTSAKKLIAETGSYDLTGTDVTLIYTPGGGGEILIIDSGVYSLAGDEVLLRVDLKLVNDSGNYLLSGTNTTIKYGASIIAETNSYSLTGTNLNLFANYGMIATSNSYTLTGTTVTLKYSGDVNQVIGTVTAGFAPDLYSAGYKPTTITVTFKE